MNRLVRPVMFAFEPDVVFAFARVAFGATGAPTLNTAKSKGICDVTRNSTGNYTVTFGSQFTPFKRLDTYVKLLGVNHVFENATMPAAPQMYITSNDISDSTKASVTVQFANAGSVTDPGSAEVVRFAFQLCRSNAI